MITINNVVLPEIDRAWIDTHYRDTFVRRQPIEVLLASQPPTEERFRGPGCNSDFDLGIEAYRRTTHRITGRMIYPPGGFMDWHTNGDYPGRRLYAAWSEAGQSGMLWFRDGHTVVEWDKPGWNIRTFVCPVWHAVFAKGWRVSVGWNLELPPNEVENLVHAA